MSREKIVIIAGNGLSVDILDHVLPYKQSDLNKVFNNGQYVPVPLPQGGTGFLSEQCLPVLWKRGARPWLSLDESKELFRTIVTSASIAIRKMSYGDHYGNALWLYQELLHFVRHKFIYEHNITKPKANYHKWPFLKFLKDKLLSDASVTIITYNYDLWLETAIQQASIPFFWFGTQGALEKQDSVKIIKPHGSINFQQKLPISSSPIKYPLTHLLFGNRSSEINIIPETELENALLQVDLIPPTAMAGEISYNKDFNWWNNFHGEAMKECKTATKIIWIGLSYDTVDRPELNDLLAFIPAGSSKIRPVSRFDLIDPNPNRILIKVIEELYGEFGFHSHPSIDNFISSFTR